MGHQNALPPSRHGIPQNSRGKKKQRERGGGEERKEKDGVMLEISQQIGR
jgi:hypothetical protein